jgi:hypothetical protein
MALLTWDAGKYSVRINAIDRQHQKLFALLNDLYDAMQQGRGKAITGKVLASLIASTPCSTSPTRNSFFACTGIQARRPTRQNT